MVARFINLKSYFKVVIKLSNRGCIETLLIQNDRRICLNRRFLVLSYLECLMFDETGKDIFSIFWYSEPNTTNLSIHETYLEMLQT